MNKSFSFETFDAENRFVSPRYPSFHPVCCDRYVPLDVQTNPKYLGLLFKYCVKWVPVTTAWRVLRLRMEERPPVWRVAANKLNKQSRTADKWWSSSYLKEVYEYTRVVPKVMSNNFS